jgi:transcriptional regulator
MYIPRHNEEKQVPVMQALMVSHPFATLVTLGANGLFASHIPMVFEDDGSPFGVLRGHISRANTQWRDFSPAVDALAIFGGDHHYITPSWYSENEKHAEEVPTWNYAVVHAYAPLKVIEDPEWLLTHVSSLTNIHEAGFPVPWKVSDAPRDRIRALLNGIIGLELPIRRLEGKWKVSQNRTERERKGVIDGLKELNTPQSLTMKSLVEGRRD